MTEHIMTYTDYTHDEWVKARAWAQCIVDDAEKHPEHYSDRQHLVLAARTLLDLPEPEKPTRTLADMTDKERRNYIGGACSRECSDLLYFYLGSTQSGHHLAIAFSEGAPVVGYTSDASEIVPLPDEPRLAIPGVTRPYIQQEPPADMQGWWATETAYARVLLLDVAADDDRYIKAYVPGESMLQNLGPCRYVKICNLTDWSRERDIEGAGCSD